MNSVVPLGDSVSSPFIYWPVDLGLGHLFHLTAYRYYLHTATLDPLTS